MSGAALRGSFRSFYLSLDAFTVFLVFADDGFTLFVHSMLLVDQTVNSFSVFHFVIGRAADV